jgi:secondary thiamine-phosphate synthase enzyme
MLKIEIKTTKRYELIDITDKIQKEINKYSIKEGLCNIFVPHTTAAITINENADPEVSRDILRELDRLIPREGNYGHTEGNADSHIKSSLIGVSTNIPIENGSLLLGRWQAIFFCEFDGPRTRKIYITLIK